EPGVTSVTAAGRCPATPFIVPIRGVPVASPSAPTDSVLTARPIVSELEHGATGRLFSIRFESGQRLPPHRNAARVIMTAVAGSGEILITGDGMRVLPCGAVVQLDPDV